MCVYVCVMLLLFFVLPFFLANVDSVFKMKTVCVHFRFISLLPLLLLLLLLLHRAPLHVNPLHVLTLSFSRSLMMRCSIVLVTCALVFLFLFSS